MHDQMENYCLAVAAVTRIFHLKCEMKPSKVPGVSPNHFCSALTVMLYTVAKDIKFIVQALSKWKG
jgi:hypothetical protein